MPLSLSRRRSARWAAALSVAAVGAGVPAVGADAATSHHAATSLAAGTNSYRQTNLISDEPGKAQFLDENVVNPWGLALGPTPLWVANNGTNTATVYVGANGTDPVQRVLLVKTSFGPTGQVFNGTKGFAFQNAGSRQPSRFLFDSFRGAVMAWTNEPTPMPSTKDVARIRNHVYLGLAIAQTPRGPRLYAADATGGVDVFDGKFRLISHPGAFQDRQMAPGLTPYNVAVIGNRVFVSYASEDPPTSVRGAIDVYSFGGRLMQRLVRGGRLNGPWGMVVAPPHWGKFGGDLLVGNEDGGRINVYGLKHGHFLGTLRRADGTVIANDGLWGLVFGNGIFGRPDDLIFAAGPDEYQHGLVGAIRPN